jgi:hypothetical protein
MGSKRSRRAAGSLTLRERLAEIEACEDSGESLKAYAIRRGISVHSLYQAKKMARQQGLLPPHRNEKTKSSRTKAVRPPRFVEATSVLSSRPPSAAWRVHFAGGEILESNTPLGVEVALRLIESLGSHS